MPSKFYVDPVKITRYNLKPWQLQATLLFWICAAGKNAASSAKGLDRFLTQAHQLIKPSRPAPFFCIRKISHRALPTLLKHAGVGCYNQKGKTFWQLAHAGLDLSTCTTVDLE